MAIGTAMGGWRIIKTVGSDFVELQPVHGFSAETSSSAVIESVILERPGVSVAPTAIVSMLNPLPLNSPDTRDSTPNLFSTRKQTLITIYFRLFHLQRAASLTADLLLTNAKAYLNKEIVDCNLAIEKGSIFKIGKEAHMPKADERINMRNLLVLPGLIDSHVHLRDEEKAYKEDFCTGTAAAAAGGFTTVLDMPNNEPVTMSAEALRNRMCIAERKALVNVGFYSEFPIDLNQVGAIVGAHVGEIQEGDLDNAGHEKQQDWNDKRQLDELLDGRGDDIDFVDEQAEPVAEVKERRVERRAGRGVEHQARRIRLAADAQGVDLERGFALGDRRADFEHVRAQDLHAPGRQV
jgi:hypothetical protein